MPVKTLGTLTLDLVAKTGGYVQGLSKAERESEKFRRQVKQKFQDVGKAAGIALAAGATAAAAGLAIMIQRQRQVIDAQAKMAQRLRTTSASLAVLDRATQRTGITMQQVEVAVRTLDINLGRAEQGVLRQAEAFDRLGLSVEELSKLSADERIAAINQALKENIPLAERAAVAADLFGSRGASAIQQLNADVIATAAHEVEVFGLAISDIDAAKIENANDSFSRLSLVSKGLGQRLTIEVAPALEALGNLFFEYAEDAGGANQLVADSFEGVIRAIAFVADAADGIGRAFTSAADIAIIGIAKLAQEAAESVGSFLDLVDNLPLIDYSDEVEATREFARVQGGIIREAQANLRRALDTPLNGQRLVEAYEAARAASQAAAEAAVAARNDESAFNGELDITETKLEAITVTAQKFKRSAELDTIIKNWEDYADLVAELRTDEEKLTDQMRERFEVLNKIAGITREERENVAGRIFDAASTEAPEFGGLAPEIGGVGGEFDKINKARDELNEWYAEQLELLNTFREEQAELNGVWDEKELELWEAQAERLAEIEKARQVVALTTTEELFGNLAGLAKQFAGEQSEVYRVLFAAEKAAAIARSIIAIQTGIAQAAAQPFPANLAAMASVAAATASIISTITSTTIQGQAHDGLMSVPRTGTYLLEKGERVTTADTSAKLDRTLSDVQRDMSGGTQSGPNLRIINAFDTAIIGDYLGSSEGESLIMNTVRRNQRTVRSLVT